MSKYPLDNNVLQEEYEALLIKLALKEYAAEQSEKLMRESNEQLSTQPKQKDHVIAAAFRQATWEDMRSRITHGIGYFWQRRCLSLPLLLFLLKFARRSID